MSHAVIRSFGTVAGDSLSNCSAGAAPSHRSQRLDSRPLWCSRLAAGDPRITVVAPACSRSASALTSRLTIRPSRRRFAARLNSGVRRGEKAFRVSGIDFGCNCTRRVSSLLFRHSFVQCAARRMSHVVIRSFGTVAGDSLSNCSAGAAPSLRSQRLDSRPLWCSRLAASDPRITVAATACSRPASALTSRLTIRSSRRRFVPAKSWQRKPASFFPPLRHAA